MPRLLPVHREGRFGAVHNVLVARIEDGEANRWCEFSAIGRSFHKVVIEPAQVFDVLRIVKIFVNDALATTLFWQ